MDRKPTIGFISTWPVYQGTTIDRYAHSLIQGVGAAANERGRMGESGAVRLREPCPAMNLFNQP